MNHPAIARRSLLTAAGCALLRPAAASSGHERLQNKTYAADIIVIGFGAAGASAAIEAARAGSSVLILEKSPQKSHCSSTRMSSGIYLCPDRGISEEVLAQYTKATFLSNLPKYINPEGIIFMSFPAWQMPFGGHQQICKSKIISHFPFIHLLPAPIYKGILKFGGESTGCIEELLSIKETKTSIELFEKLVHEKHITIIDRQLFFINPHYEIKFRLKPRRLYAIIAGIPYLRNFFTTSCFYTLK